MERKIANGGISRYDLLEYQTSCPFGIAGSNPARGALFFSCYFSFSSSYFLLGKSIHI